MNETKIVTIYQTGKADVSRQITVEVPAGWDNDTIEEHADELFAAAEYNTWFTDRESHEIQDEDVELEDVKVCDIGGEPEYVFVPKTGTEVA